MKQSVLNDRETDVRKRISMLSGISANEILLAVYMLIMCLSSIYLYVTHNKLHLAIITAALFFALLVLSKWIISGTRRLMNVCYSAKENADLSDWDADHKHVIPAFLIFSLITFLILMIWYIAFCPGSFEEDNIFQLKQVLTGKYDDWHPVWHTLVFYTLPVKITGRVESIVPFQMLCFSLAMGYMCSVLYHYAGKVFSVLSFLFVMINPITGYILLYPFKDDSFAIAGMLVSAMVLEIYFEGERACIWYKCVILGFILASGTIFRHNGILFTGMIVIALLFKMDKKKWLAVALSFAGFMILIKGPIYSSVGVEDSVTEVIQVVGFPMSVIGNVAKETPDLMDEKTSEFVYSIAPAKVWEERFQRGNFNLMKYGGISDQTPIENAGAVEICRMALRCVLRSPQAAIDSVFSLTDFVYGFDTQDKADIDIMRTEIIENEYGLIPHGNSALATGISKYTYVLKMKGANFVRKLGFINLVLVILVLASLGWTSAAAWKKAFFLLAVLAYDFGTMLLLSGHDARFFYIAFAVFPVFVAIGLYGNDKKEI